MNFLYQVHYKQNYNLFETLDLNIQCDEARPKANGRLEQNAGSPDAVCSIDILCNDHGAGVIWSRGFGMLLDDASERWRGCSLIIVSAVRHPCRVARNRGAARGEDNSSITFDSLLEILNRYSRLVSK